MLNESVEGNLLFIILHLTHAVTIELTAFSSCVTITLLGQTVWNALLVHVFSTADRFKAFKILLRSVMVMYFDDVFHDQTSIEELILAALIMITFIII